MKLLSSRKIIFFSFFIAHNLHATHSPCTLPLKDQSYNFIIQEFFDEITNHQNLEKDPSKKLQNIIQISDKVSISQTLNRMLIFQLINTNNTNNKLAHQFLSQEIYPEENNNENDCSILALSSDTRGNLIATRADGTIIQWNQFTQNRRKAHASAIKLIDIDIDTIFFTEQNGYHVNTTTLSEFDFKNLQPLETIIHQAEISTMLLDHEEKLLFIGDENGNISIWNSKSKELLNSFESGEKIITFSFDPQRKVLTSIGQNSLIQQYNLSTKIHKIIDLKSFTSTINNYHMLNKEQALFTTTLNQLAIWNLTVNKGNLPGNQTARLIRTIPNKKSHFIFVDLKNNVSLCQLSVPCSQNTFVCMPFFKSTSRISALHVSKTGLIIWGTNKGAITTNKLLTFLPLLNIFHIKLLMLLQESKNENRKVFFSETWLKLFLSLPDEFYDEFYDTLSIEAKSSVLAYKLWNYYND